ncbi:hypothetical protein PF005_g11398 [Phytophthora fragariae]|uniref:Uncharacterized protein n=1 Tax=Phytophthora fragariae TaxID=53985 RepID=A0A6A3Y0W6_9STRA|nr:hypothetical protein PF005_g11398 [Phytophthora fragariae]
MAMPSPGRDTPAVKTSPAEKEKTESVRITNTSTLPVTSRYAGSTMKDLQRFMSAYDTYYHSLIGALRREHAMYEFQKIPNEVSEGEGISYFLQAREPELEDYTAVDLTMKQFKMKTTFLMPCRVWVSCG